MIHENHAWLPVTVSKAAEPGTPGKDKTILVGRMSWFCMLNCFGTKDQSITVITSLQLAYGTECEFVFRKSISSAEDRA